MSDTLSEALTGMGEYVEDYKDLQPGGRLASVYETVTKAMKLLLMDLDTCPAGEHFTRFEDRLVAIVRLKDERPFEEIRSELIRILEGDKSKPTARSRRRMPTGRTKARKGTASRTRKPTQA